MLFARRVGVCGYFQVMGVCFSVLVCVSLFCCVFPMRALRVFSSHALRVFPSRARGISKSCSRFPSRARDFHGMLAGFSSRAHDFHDNKSPSTFNQLP